MRKLLLLLIPCLLTAAAAQQKGNLPTNGNGLLDACTVMVDAADNPSYLTSLSGDRFTESMTKFDWCAGYLEATREVYLQNHINLAIVAMTGVTFAGPEKSRETALKILDPVCIPDEAPILQLGRVLVKWLREHPEKLHELKGTLTWAAFMDAFPCKDIPPATEANPPKDATKPKSP